MVSAAHQLSSAVQFIADCSKSFVWSEENNRDNHSNGDDSESFRLSELEFGEHIVTRGSLWYRLQLWSLKDLCYLKVRISCHLTLSCLCVCASSLLFLKILNLEE